KMYLCHITLLMLKDTKSLGNNNASAWESRGVVIKKEGMHFDTPSYEKRNYLLYVIILFLSGFHQWP
ncbi:MAG: hypothetical protein H9949_12390, partial [Candidatus Phocaeicola merdigallinarum]|nr:hypothetical protein [Candidatus Phocaeicola merdigallinarum]